MKLMPPDVGAKPALGKELGSGAEGNKGAGGMEKPVDDDTAEDAVEFVAASCSELLASDAVALADCSPFPPLPLLWIVDVKLASKAATASGDKV